MLAAFRFEVFKFWSFHLYQKSAFKTFYGLYNILKVSKTSELQLQTRPTFTTIALPRQSLRRGRQKSISTQGSGFQKWRSCPDTLLNEFTCSNTLAWYLQTRVRLRSVHNGSVGRISAVLSLAAALSTATDGVPACGSSSAGTGLLQVARGLWGATGVPRS